MSWSEEQREAYGAELASSPSEDRLRGIVSAWLGAHPQTDPIEMIQWMRDAVDHDPFLLFDEEGGIWLQERLYGDLGEEPDELSTSLFMGLDAGP